jgi:3,4-dihydroxy 2-butanone 4-phosphate synthase / GTP cyclohydrolase II
MNFNTIPQIIADIKQGKMVIILDDEKRENEGDLIMAASCVTPADINFMTKEGRGLICLTLTQKKCEQLSLPLMVDKNQDNNSTNFTVSIEASSGVTTGISAADRATTILAAVKKNANKNDIVQPGHIFPLMAKKGGVLNRAGHTEAGCDLAKMAGFEAASVIVEILNEDGSMARAPDLEIFAKKHNLKIGTIEDLIKYKIAHEKTIKEVAKSDFNSKYGDFVLHAFTDNIENKMHLALCHGKIKKDAATVVRVHMEDSLCDLLHPKKSCSWPLINVLKKIQEYESGVVVILRKNESDDSLIARINNIKTKFDNAVQKKHNDVRTVGVGAQILSQLGVKKMRLLSAPKTFVALGGFGLEVVEFIKK